MTFVDEFVEIESLFLFFSGVLLYSLVCTAVICERNYTELFHVTSRVTNQTECMKEEKAALFSLCWGTAFATLMFLLLIEWKLCDYNSRHGSPTLNLLFVFYKKDFISSQLPSSPNEPVKSHILPMCQFEMQILKCRESCIVILGFTLSTIL